MSYGVFLVFEPILQIKNFVTIQVELVRKISEKGLVLWKL